MVSASFNAGLLRVVTRVAATAPDRLSIWRVLVERCRIGGVLLVATDGHRMLVAHDPNGRADSDLLVRLPRHAQAACKAGRYEDPRRVDISGADAEVRSGDGNLHCRCCSVAIVAMPRISESKIAEGCYPDWRRALPAGTDAASPTAIFNGKYLRDMARIGRAFVLANHAELGGLYPPMRFSQAGAESPVLIRWESVENAFGVLMPMRYPDEESWRGVPNFALAGSPIGAAA